MSYVFVLENSFSQRKNEKFSSRNVLHLCLTFPSLSIKKDDPSITSVDWGLKNEYNIPISSGLYIIHVDVPGVGQRVLKWLGVMRPIDLDTY